MFNKINNCFGIDFNSNLNIFSLLSTVIRTKKCSKAENSKRQTPENWIQEKGKSIQYLEEKKLFFFKRIRIIFISSFKLKTHSASIGSTGTGEASESDRESGDSDKESMSDKESDSTGTFQSKPHGLNGAGAAAAVAAVAAAAAAATATTNSNDGITENKEKDPKDARGKRGRRPNKDNIYHNA